MKNYRKDIVTQYPNGTVQAPIYFNIDSINDPVIGTETALVYNHQGKYLGWTSDLESVRKYLYGQLYYKTDRKYRIESTRGYHNRYEGKKVNIIERGTSNTGLVIRYREIKADDLVNEADINSTTQLQIDAVENFQPGSWNFTAYPDKFGMLSHSGLQNKFLKEFEEMVARQKQEVISYLKAKRDVQNGLMELASGYGEDDQEQNTEMAG